MKIEFCGKFVRFLLQIDSRQRQWVCECVKNAYISRGLFFQKIYKINKSIDSISWRWDENPHLFQHIRRSLQLIKAALFVRISLQICLWLNSTGLH